MASTTSSRPKMSSVSQRHVSTSHSVRSTYPSTSATPRPTSTSDAFTSRGRGHPKTVTGNEQHLICAVSESRGISPIVGLAFVNLSTTEAVLCQISDNQTYTKTEQKLSVYMPSEIIFMSTSVQPKSNLYLTIEEHLPHVRLKPIDRKYFEELKGMDYVERLSIRRDVQAIKACLLDNYYAACCFAAVGLPSLDPHK